MTNNIGVEQSGKSGGDAFGHSTSGSSAIGGAGLGNASAFGGGFGASGARRLGLRR